MDHNRIYQLYLNKKFTDVEIILDDCQNQLNLLLHKSILILHSPYFEKLLMFGDTPSIFTLNIPNAYVAQDLILSFYGQDLNTGNLAKWPHAVALAKSRDYFGLEAIPVVIPEKIDGEDYDCILELCSMIGFDEHNLHILSDNLPVDYDLSKLSKDFINEVIKIKTSYTIASCHDNKIIWNDIKTGNMVNSFEHSKGEIREYTISNNNQYLLTESTTGNYVWDVKSSKLKYSFGICIAHDFSTDNAYLAIAEDGNIKVLDLFTEKIIAEKHINEIIRFIEFVPGSLNESLAMATLNSCILWNIRTNVLRVFGQDECMYLSFSSNGKYLGALFSTINTDLYTHLWDISTETPMELFPNISILIVSLKDDNYAVIKKDEDNIEINDIDNNICRYTFSSKLSWKIPFENNNYLVLSDNPYTYTQIIDIKNGQKIFNFSTRPFLEFSPRGKFLAEYYGFDIKILDITTTKILFYIYLVNPIISIKFTPDDRYLMVNNGRGLYVYDTNNGLITTKIYVNDINFWNFKIYHNELCQRLLEQKID